MSVNKYKPHVWLIPEDDANRQIIDGFRLHDSVDLRAVGVRAPAGGWARVLDVFEKEYLPLLRGSANAHVIMLVDFDGKADERKIWFGNEIPEDVRSRVFVIGSKDEPETFKHELNLGFEDIGRRLAQNCLLRDFELWRHPHLIHNEPELRRLVEVVRPILFP